MSHPAPPGPARCQRSVPSAPVDVAAVTAERGRAVAAADHPVAGEEEYRLHRLAGNVEPGQRGEHEAARGSIAEC